VLLFISRSSFPWQYVVVVVINVQKVGGNRQLVFAVRIVGMRRAPLFCCSFIDACRAAAAAASTDHNYSCSIDEISPEFNCCNSSHHTSPRQRSVFQYWCILLICTLLPGYFFPTVRLPRWSDQPIQSVSLAVIIHTEVSVSFAAQLGHCCSSFLCCCSETLELSSTELSNCSIR